jgi:RHS repeat-associated protein
LAIGNAVATDAYAYDDAGQLAVETQSVAGHPAAMRTLTHSHDADGLRTGLVYPGGKVLAAGYTARGQLATMTFHGQPVATSTYRPNGQPIGTVYGNGAQRTLSYDAAGRLTGTGTNVGAATITGRGYALDAVGRRTGYVDETAANAVFSYDPAGQVLGGTVPVPGQPASVNTYAYDPEGNRTQSSTGIQPAPADPVTITGSTTYTANPLNQYTAITGNPNPTYDADGNLLSGLRSPLSGFTSTWNGENRMLSSTSANVAITDRRVENAYDALGRRVRKTVKFTSTGVVIEDRYFIYDGWNVIEETIAPATGPVETAEAIWGTDLSGTAQGAGGVGGLLLRETSATGASYYHYDGNGNVTALTSAAGGVQAAYTYGPFGETLRAAGPLAQANPWRFSTKYQDEETGLLYYGYRFYNPTDGRWPSRDPIGEEGGINVYAIVANNTVTDLDYLGLAGGGRKGSPPPRDPALKGGISGRGTYMPPVRIHTDQLKSNQKWIYSRHSVIVNCPTGDIEIIRQFAFSQLRTFAVFNNEFATVTMRKDGVAWFDLKGAAGFASDLSMFLPGGNDGEVPVFMKANQDNLEVTGTTADNHQLIGIRKWGVVQHGNPREIVIQTYAYEIPRGVWNNAGEFLGRRIQVELWKTYMESVAHSVEKKFGGYRHEVYVEPPKATEIGPNPLLSR